MHLTPSAWASRQFGGDRALARALGRHRSVVYHWRRRVDGLTPCGLQPTILRIALARSLDVQPVDLILGRELPDPVPTLAQQAPQREPQPAPVRAPGARQTRRLP